MNWYNGSLPKIYTKTGDRGETGLATGQRVPKDEALLEAYGTVDELNSWLGAARSEKPIPELDGKLERVQRELFEVGTDLAAPWERRARLDEKQGPRITPLHTERLEKEIDEIEEKLPRLTQFILPGGGPQASFLHLARTICRRAERKIAGLLRGERCNPEIGVYMNRLSDWLFVMARYSNWMEGRSDMLWSGRSEEE